MLQADSVHFDDVLMSDTRKTERDNFLRNFVQNAPCKCRLPTTMGVCWASIASRCFQKCKIGAFMSCAFFCRSCRQHKWLLLNVHDADSLSRTLCDQGVYCYYTGRKHLPVAGSPDAPVGFIKCVVGRVSQGILKKGMCDLYKFCVWILCRTLCG